jgi:hypothetical protein
MREDWQYAYGSLGEQVRWRRIPHIEPKKETGTEKQLPGHTTR